MKKNCQNINDNFFSFFTKIELLISTIRIQQLKILAFLINYYVKPNNSKYKYSYTCLPSINAIYIFIKFSSLDLLDFLKYSI